MGQIKNIKLHIVTDIKGLNKMNCAEASEEFGIQRIVDVRLDNEGKQMYKVRWSETWEPAESLATCQHLVDDFWSTINKAKMKERVAQETLKQMTFTNNNNMGISRLSEDSKSEIRDLISRTNGTSAGNLISPSAKIKNEHSKSLINMNDVKPSVRNKVKTESDSKSSGGLNNSTLKYLENFDNPYVKVIVVCKVCNKEAPKAPSKWKVHYLTHVSEEDRPFKCEVCNQGFIQKIHLQKHMKKHESKDNDQMNYQQQQQVGSYNPSPSKL